MRFCTECGAQMEDGDLVCTQCGTRIEEPDAAPAPEPKEAPASERASSTIIIPGAARAAASPSTRTAAPAAPAAPAAKRASKPVMSKKMIAIIAGVLVLAVVAGIVIACVSGGSEPVYGVYYQEGEVYVVTFDFEDPILLTDDLGDWGKDVMNAIVMTPDGEYILYPDEVDAGDDSATLLFRETTDPEGEAIKIASKVTQYFVADDSDTVIYQDEGGDLCRYSLSSQESEEIESAVKDFWCSEDGENILYYTSETKKGKTVEEWYRIMDGDISEPLELPSWQTYDASDDLSVIVYEEKHKETDKADKKYKTYMIDENGEETLLDTQVVNCWIMEDNSVYYAKKGEGIKLSKLIKNDNNSSFNLGDKKFYPYDLYKFDDESVLLAEGIGNSTRVSYENGYIAYKALDTSGKVKTSKLQKSADLNDYESVCDALMTELTVGLGFVVDDETSVLDYEEIHAWGVSSDFDRVYIISDWEAKEGGGTLYAANLSGGEVDVPEEVADEVSEAFFCGEDLYYVSKDDLYVEGEKKAIAKDFYSYAYREETNVMGIKYSYDDDVYSMGLYDGELEEVVRKATLGVFLENGAVVYRDKDEDWFYYLDGDVYELDGDILRFDRAQNGGWGFISGYIPGSGNGGYYYPEDDYDYGYSYGY